MSDAFVISAVASHLSPGEVAGKDVVELGSMIVDEGCREYITSLGPRRYVGVDIGEGPGVDLVMDAREAPARIPGPWDVVVCCSMLEHADDWYGAVVAIKKLCRPGTILVMTVPTIGFRYHAYPGDHWRFTANDWAEIFADMEILKLTEDVEGRQIFMKARAKEITGRYTPALPIYNVVYERPVKPLTDAELRSKRYARLAWLRKFKVGVQDVMGAAALLLAVSKPYRAKALPRQAADRPAEPDWNVERLSTERTCWQCGFVQGRHAAGCTEGA